MKKCHYLGILLGLAMPSLLFAAVPSSIKFIAPKKATTDVFSCEEHAATDEGYTNWFTEKYACLQADPSSPYQGYVGICQGSVCESEGQLGVVELQAAPPAGVYLAISADGTTNWTALTGLPTTGPAVVTLNAAGKTTANKAACQCVEGTYPGIPDSYSCKTNGQPGHYVNCIPGVPKK